MTLKGQSVIVVLLATCMVSTAISASAFSVAYSSKTAFLADAGATTDMPAILPDEGRVAGYLTSESSYSIGSLSFSLGAGATTLFVGAAGEPQVTGGDWTLLHDGPDIALSGMEDLDVLIDLASAGPVFSFGFDVVEPTVNNVTGPNVVVPFMESRFLVRLYDQSTLVESFSFEPDNDVLAFAGIWTDVAFDSVSIEETAGGIENEFFGHFYMGGTAAVATPEPGGTLYLLALSCGLCLVPGPHRRK